DLALALDPERYQPVVCCYANWGELARELELAGVEIFILRRRPGIDLTYMFALAREMRARRIDMVHSLNARKAYVVGVLSALMAGVSKGVASFHTHPSTVNPLLSHAGRLCGEVVGRVVASSKAVNESLLRERWIPPGKAVVIPDGVNPARFNQPGQREAAREHWNLAENELVIGSVISSRDTIGLERLLETFRILSEARPELRFLVAGVHGESDSHTTFLGPSTDNPAFFAALDHLCLPRVDRVVPLTLLEALISKVPVTAGRSEIDRHQPPAGPWAFAQRTDSTPSALAAGILSLLANPRKSASLALAGAACALERHSIEHHVNRIQTLYDSLD
ncbi:MAG: glycosyltransferase involved in cell wall biosynthesis, partial [Planctomycetota bacterium]